MNKMSKRRESMGEEKWIQYQKGRNSEKAKRWKERNRDSIKKFAFLEELNFKEKKIKDITGMRSGQLVAIRPLGRDTRKPQILWECICDCGNYTLVPTYKITGQGARSCGCMKSGGFKKTGYVRGQIAKPKESYGEIPLWYYNRLKNGAKKRGIVFNVTIEYLDDLFKNQNRICTMSGRTLYFYYGDRCSETTASVDRIDSSKGYVKGNLQWIHKTINHIKFTDSMEEFLEKCKIVSEVGKYLKL